ncbi:TraX family protein [Leuconostoc citreum]
MKNIKGFTSFDLKIIGILLMVGDHVYDAYAHSGAPMWLTVLGRVVAPIFLFLSAEGFFYTHSKIGYMKNLLVFYWITTISIQIVQNIFPNNSVTLINSMLGTLFLSVLAMWSWDGIKSYKNDKSYFYKAIFGWLYLIITPIVSLISMTLFPNQLIASIVILFPNVFFVEGNIGFVLMGLLFYIFRKNRLLQLSVLILISFMVLASANMVQFAMILAIIPLALYNGQEGRKMKWFFYIFYPVHIIIIYLVATLL